MRALLRFVGYYRRFCPQFATLARPLNKLTGKEVKFQWGNEEEEAFQKLKQNMIEAPILAYPDAQTEYILDTDASLDGAGEVLSQVQDGIERIIAFYSKTFNSAQRNYCVTR